MYMDDIKQFEKNKKELGTLIQALRIQTWNFAYKNVPC